VFESSGVRESLARVLSSPFRPVWLLFISVNLHWPLFASTDLYWPLLTLSHLHSASLKYTHFQKLFWTILPVELSSEALSIVSVWSVTLELNSRQMRSMNSIYCFHFPSFLWLPIFDSFCREFLLMQTWSGQHFPASRGLWFLRFGSWLSLFGDLLWSVLASRSTMSSKSRRLLLLYSSRVLLALLTCSNRAVLIPSFSVLCRQMTLPVVKTWRNFS